MKRIKTEIEGFDELVEGGLPEKSITLVSGTPGTGKSIFSMQFLINCAKRGEKSIYISFEENEESLRLVGEQFNWPVEELEKQNKLKLVYVNLRSDDSVNDVIKLINDGNYERVVLDSLSDLSVYPGGLNANNLTLSKVQEVVLPIPLEREYVLRMQVQELINNLRQTNATVLLTSELPKESQWYSRDTISEFSCDSIVVLHSIEGEEGFRTLHIPKIRKTKQKAGLFNFEITKTGIVVKSN